jgi:probable HAF family extracellular repeat protein
MTAALPEQVPCGLRRFNKTPITGSAPQPAKGGNMKPRVMTCITAMTLFAALAIQVRPRFAAQEAPTAQGQAAGHFRYKLVDLGTLGGPHSYGSVNGEGFSLLNNSGVVASYADLALPDPNAAFFCYDQDCFQAHAVQWKDGEITDLGALPANNNSAAGSINARGWITGQSQSALIDPVLGFPEFRAVLWKDGQIIDLGTLASGAESIGIYVNDAGEVIGASTISTEQNDPVGFIGFSTHTFIWKDERKVDIGTLGGNDAFVGASCSHPPEGVIAGASTTSTALNPDTGLPTIDPFLWRNGAMTDLGTLGGTIGFGQCANRRGQVIGVSSVTTNPAACAPPALFGAPAVPGCHAFSWENGVMTDLGMLGGEISEAIWLNETGMVVGSADLPGGQIHHAVFWKDGVIHDLGTVSGDACSRGRGLNARGEVVGGSSDCHNFLHAFVSEDGGPAIDLNSLIPPGSGLQVTNAFNINDRGEILAKGAPLGFTPNDDADLGHLVLLIPCGEGEGGCGDRAERPGAATQINPASTSQRPSTATPANPALSGRGILDRLRGRRFPGPG